MNRRLIAEDEELRPPVGELVALADKVYALGAVAYYLLTGTRVFSGGGALEICMKHVTDPPEPPSARVGRPVSPDLEALVLRCLAKSPADRPPDAADLRRALESCTVARTWTAAEAAARWSAYRPAPAIERSAATDTTVPPEVSITPNLEPTTIHVD